MNSGFVHTIVVDKEVLVLHYIPENAGYYKVIALNNPDVSFELKNEDHSWLIVSEVQDYIKTAESLIVEGLVAQLN